MTTGLGAAVRIDARVADLPISPTLAARARADELARRGARVHKLGLGQSPFPVPEVVVSALRASAPMRDYLPVRGLPALREAVAEHHRRRHDVARGADDVLVGPGSKELLFLLQLCFDGELIIPAPGWVSYAPQAQMCGRLARFVQPTGDDLRLTPDALDAACAGSRPGSTLLVLNYPNNPSGITYSDAELAALAAVCLGRGVVVLADEIYGDLAFDGAHRSIARHHPEGTILASGLSKWCGAGGWRLGTFSFPPQLRHLAGAMAAAGSETFSSTSAPIQHAAVTAFRGGAAIEAYLADARRILAALCGWAAAALRGAGLRVPEPRGGFYVFADFAPHAAALRRRGIVDDVGLAAALLDELGISCLPGTEFGMPSGSLHLRFALVDFDGARALATVRDRALDVATLEVLAPSVVEAVRSITGWLDRERAGTGAARHSMGLHPHE